MKRKREEEEEELTLSKQTKQDILQQSKKSKKQIQQIIDLNKQNPFSKLVQYDSAILHKITNYNSNYLKSLHYYYESTNYKAVKPIFSIINLNQNNNNQHFISLFKTYNNKNYLDTLKNIKSIDQIVEQKIKPLLENESNYKHLVNNKLQLETLIDRFNLYTIAIPPNYEYSTYYCFQDSFINKFLQLKLNLVNQVIKKQFNNIYYKLVLLKHKNILTEIANQKQVDPDQYYFTKINNIASIRPLQDIKHQEINNYKKNIIFLSQIKHLVIGYNHEQILTYDQFINNIVTYFNNITTLSFIKTETDQFFTNNNNTNTNISKQSILFNFLDNKINQQQANTINRYKLFFQNLKQVNLIHYCPSDYYNQDFTMISANTPLISENTNYLNNNLIFNNLFARLIKEKTQYKQDHCLVKIEKYEQASIDEYVLSDHYTQQVNQLFTNLQHDHNYDYN